METKNMRLQIGFRILWVCVTKNIVQSKVAYGTWVAFRDLEGVQFHSHSFKLPTQYRESFGQLCIFPILLSIIGQGGHVLSQNLPLFSSQRTFKHALIGSWPESPPSVEKLKMEASIPALNSNAQASAVFIR